ncbi:MAG: FAD-binding oxidoreductase [Zestosphaera sp.]
MTFSKSLLAELAEVVGSRWLVTEKSILERYLQDETVPSVRPKASEEVVVVKPGSTEEVAEVLKVANKYKIPVYPRGGGTGLVGGAVPTRPGMVLSLERLDRIDVDAENMVAEAEAGVTLGRLLEEAEKHDLMFPPHPGDEGAFVGGLVACNAGGSRAVRTGILRNYVLGLEVVLPTGTILKIGGKTLKNNMGLNLAHLFIGCEGVLGVITKAWLRLYPRWRYTATLITPFNESAAAFRTARKILAAGVVPLAMEYFDRRVIEASAKHLGVPWPVTDGQHFLMIILAEALEDMLYVQLDHMNNIAREEGGLESFIAQRNDEQKQLLRIRSEIFPALKNDTHDILDTTVPIGAVERFIDGIARIESKHGIWLPVFGHVGDGNLHVHVLNYPNSTVEELERIVEEVYETAVALGGTITGEHGVGYVRRKYVRRILGDTWVETMSALKRTLDPNNILNPDKVLP